MISPSSGVKTPSNVIVNVVRYIETMANQDIQNLPPTEYSMQPP